MVAESNQRQNCTILLPIRNGESFISESLENLLSMADANDEILIVNDGSTDQTLLKLREYQDRDHRIIVVTSPALGLVTALNKGLEVATNEIIARADVDDFYSLDRLKLQVKMLQINPDTAAVFSDYIFWSEEKSNLGYMPTGISSTATKLSLVDAFRTPHPSVVFRKDAVLSVGGYQAADFPAEDLGLWLRLSRKFDLATVPSPLLRYRISLVGISASRQKEMQLKRNALLANLDYVELIEVNIDSYSEIKRTYAEVSHRSARLALYNFDLFLCIRRAKLSPLQKAPYFVRVFGRFFNPTMALAFFSLLLERRVRKRVKTR